MYFTGFTIKTMPLSYCNLAADITKYSKKEGWVARTGIAPNDSFYHINSGEVYVPIKSIAKKVEGKVIDTVSEKAIEIVKEIHHDWGRLNHIQKLLEGSRVHSLLGEELDKPSTFALFYSDSGLHNKFQRRVCEYFGIQHFNLANYGLDEIRGVLS